MKRTHDRRGRNAGQNDAANLLKPALARGELRTIAATTWSEYKKYFEKRPALARRFQVVKVEEPTEEVACTMLRGIKASLEKHHNLRILDEAVTATVRCRTGTLPDGKLPDKAVSVLDTACARLSPDRIRRLAPRGYSAPHRCASKCRSACLNARRRSAATTRRSLPR